MLIAMFAAAVMLAEVTAAAPPPAAPVDEAASVKADKDKVTCRLEEVSGTKMKKKICTTARQRDERRQQDRDALDQQQRVMQKERG